MVLGVDAEVTLGKPFSVKLKFRWHYLKGPSLLRVVWNYSYFHEETEKHIKYQPFENDKIYLCVVQNREIDTTLNLLASTIFFKIKIAIKGYLLVRRSLVLH